MDSNTLEGKATLSRRTVLKIGGVSAGSLALRAAAGVGVGVLAVSSVGCDIKQADIVIDSLEEALPILKDLLPGSVSIITKALAVAHQLKDAINKNDGSALGFLEQLMAPDGLINQIADTLNLIKDDNQRRILVGMLLLANIALRAISAKLAKAVPTSLQATANAQSPRGSAIVNKAAASLDPALVTLRF